MKGALVAVTRLFFGPEICVCSYARTNHHGNIAVGAGTERWVRSVHEDQLKHRFSVGSHRSNGRKMGIRPDSADLSRWL